MPPTFLRQYRPPPVQEWEDWRRKLSCRPASTDRRAMATREARLCRLYARRRRCPRQTDRYRAPAYARSCSGRNRSGGWPTRSDYRHVIPTCPHLPDMLVRTDDRAARLCAGAQRRRTASMSRLSIVSGSRTRPVHSGVPDRPQRRLPHRQCSLSYARASTWFSAGYLPRTGEIAAYRPDLR